MLCVVQDILAGILGVSVVVMPVLVVAARFARMFKASQVSRCNMAAVRAIRQRSWELPFLIVSLHAGAA
jgi:hypothetical protein